MKYNLINFCEFDKNAVKSYCAIHNETENKNLGDITKIDISSLSKCNMITHGSPCQDFSIAGLQKGADEGTETRSSLIWNSVKIIQHCEPKFVIWENVKNVLSPKHIHNFEKYLSAMEELGYSNYYKVLNAKDYGIPQNRERIFCISIRKDIDCGFEFPSKLPSVDWWDFLNIEECRKLTNRQQRMVDYAQGENSADSITLEGIVQFEKSVISLRQSGLRFSNSPCLPTLCAAMGKGGGNFPIVSSKQRYGGLSPLQSLQLMGFTKEDFYRSFNAGVCNSEIYKQAGNSIVVNVIVEIYKQLQKYYPDDFKNVSLISLFSGIGAFEKAFQKV